MQALFLAQLCSLHRVAQSATLWSEHNWAIIGRIQKLIEGAVVLRTVYASVKLVCRGMLLIEVSCLVPPLKVNFVLVKLYYK